jgi:hypothetical protein
LPCTQPLFAFVRYIKKFNITNHHRIVSQNYKKVSLHTCDGYDQKDRNMLVKMYEEKENHVRFGG